MILTSKAVQVVNLAANLRLNQEMSCSLFTAESDDLSPLLEKDQAMPRAPPQQLPGFLKRVLSYHNKETISLFTTDPSMAT